MTSVLTEKRTDTDVSTDNTDDDFNGWFCVKTDPYPCACGNFIADYMTAMHLIIVWPTIDDPNLLAMCGVAQDHGRNPKVIEYKNDFGKCASYYEIIGNPKIQPHN